MLNALEELRKIRAARHTIKVATVYAADLLLPKEIPPTYPTTLTKSKEESADENSGEWNQSAADVLNILVEADRPIPHPEIVQLMVRRGHDKTAASQAIARCQKRRWIEHNLVTGYVLS